MEEKRIISFYLYFSPDDKEIGVLLGEVMRRHELEISWEGDEMAEELGVDVQNPQAQISLFIWSRNAMQYGRTTGFPGKKATPQNYLLVVVDDELVPDEWERFHRAILSNWDGDANDESLLNLVGALKDGDLSRLPDGVLEVKKGPPRSETDQKPKDARRDVPTHTDDAAVVDLLQRKPLARFLAEDLRRTRAENMGGSYVVHLHGRWGSGKTSLLNFIETELRNPTPTASGKETPWVVAEFNAWQHQRFGAPWWWLMEAVSREALRALRFSRPARAAWIWITNLAWLYLKGRTLSILALIIFCMGVAGLVVLGARTLIPVLGEIDFKKASDIVVFVSGIFAVAGVIGGAVIAVIRALRQDSTDAIRRLAQTARDPVRYLKDHFEKLVGRIKRPLAIVIDDLDRCESKYVVELLEGIQNLFRDCPITFVIAADRRWVQGSYASVYQGYESHMPESGRKLGQLFLEKIFQTSVPVPVLDPAVRQHYFKYLIGISEQPAEEKLKELRDRARTALKDTRTEDEVLEELGRHDEDPAFQQVFIEEAMARLASPEVAEHTEHVLENFSDLLEANPRAMKRFVNAYRVNRALDLAMRRSTASELLARWTIVSLRWPSLISYLAKNPDRVADVVNNKATGVPDEIQKLSTLQDVQNVIGKNEEQLILNKEAVQALAAELFPYAV